MHTRSLECKKVPSVLYAFPAVTLSYTQHSQLWNACNTTTPKHSTRFLFPSFYSCPLSFSMSFLLHQRGHLCCGGGDWWSSCSAGMFTITWHCGNNPDQEKLVGWEKHGWCCQLHNRKRSGSAFPLPLGRTRRENMFFYSQSERITTLTDIFHRCECRHANLFCDNYHWRKVSTSSA